MKRIKIPDIIRGAIFSIFSGSNASDKNATNSHNGKEIEPKKSGNIVKEQPNMSKADLVISSTSDGVQKKESVESNDTHKSIESQSFNIAEQKLADAQFAEKNSIDSTQIAIWEPTAYEKELVKKTWSDDFNFLYELGAKIYIYIFENNPHTKQLFPSIHQHGANYKDSREFRSQALKFVQTISHAVKNLYHMDRLAPHLYRIGERHVKFAQRGFTPEYWNIFLDAMEVSITEHIKSLNDFTAEQRVDATQVWRRLAFYIITHMKHGYFDRYANVQNGSASLC